MPSCSASCAWCQVAGKAVEDPSAGPLHHHLLQPLEDQFHDDFVRHQIAALDVLPGPQPERCPGLHGVAQHVPRSDDRDPEMPAQPGRLCPLPGPGGSQEQQPHVAMLAAPWSAAAIPAS